MKIIRVLKRYFFLKMIDFLVFPGRSIKIKIVRRLAENAPAQYCRENKKEWYEIAIFTKKGGNDFSEAVHEVRHRVQWNYPVEFFTKKTLTNNDGDILYYLEALEKQNGHLLPPHELDAVIIERKCQNDIKKAEKFLLSSFSSSP